MRPAGSPIGVNLLDVASGNRADYIQASPPRTGSPASAGCGVTTRMVGEAVPVARSPSVLMALSRLLRLAEAVSKTVVLETLRSITSALRPHVIAVSEAHLRALLISWRPSQGFEPALSP